MEEAQEFRRRVADTSVSHNCWAAIDRNGISHGSDDGEVGGTAGKPMRALLLGGNLFGVVVVVTRYYGGIKLGTGGLVRAYSSVCRAVIDAADWEEFIESVHLTVSGVAAEKTSALYKVVQSHNAEFIGDISYDNTGQCAVSIQVPEDQAPELRAGLVSLGHGEVVVIESLEQLSIRLEKEDRVQIIDESSGLSGTLGTILQQDLGCKMPHKVQLDTGRTRWFSDVQLKLVDPEQYPKPSAVLESEANQEVQLTNATPVQDADDCLEDANAALMDQVDVRDSSDTKQKFQGNPLGSNAVFDCSEASSCPDVSRESDSQVMCTESTMILDAQPQHKPSRRGLRGKLSRPKKVVARTNSSANTRHQTCGSSEHVSFFTGVAKPSIVLPHVHQTPHASLCCRPVLTCDSAGGDPHAAAVQCWFEDFVVGLDLCPWAKLAADAGTVRLVTSSATSEEGVLTDIAAEAKLLLSPSGTGTLDMHVPLRTTLLVCPYVDSWDNFSNFFSFVADLLDDDASFTIVAFHPHFALHGAGNGGLGAAAAADLISRAPRPLFQLICQSHLEGPCSGYELEDLLLQNRKRVAKLGRESFDALMRKCG